jgi:hypothetical protein
MFSALPSTSDIQAALCQPRAQSCSFRLPKWVFSFKKLELLRVNEAHRSAPSSHQRFDHPHPGLERTHSLIVLGASGQNQTSTLATGMSALTR